MALRTTKTIETGRNVYLIEETLSDGSLVYNVQIQGEDGVVEVALENCNHACQLFALVNNATDVS